MSAKQLHYIFSTEDGWLEKFIHNWSQTDKPFVAFPYWHFKPTTLPKNKNKKFWLYMYQSETKSSPGAGGKILFRFRVVEYFFHSEKKQLPDSYVHPLDDLKNPEAKVWFKCDKVEEIDLKLKDFDFGDSDPRGRIRNTVASVALKKNINGKNVRTNSTNEFYQNAKLAVLKPVVFNSRKYVEPSGDIGEGGYPSLYGFGHEEWANNPLFNDGGYQYFHTEGKGEMFKHAEHGNLGMVFYASFGGKQYAVGIAANIFQVVRGDAKAVADELNIKVIVGKKLWQLESVKKCFEHKRLKFESRWEEDYSTLNWKCPVEFVHFFDTPIELNPKKIANKSKLLTEFSGYQKTSNEIIQEILERSSQVPAQIKEWFSSDNFINPDLSIQENKKLNSTGGGAKSSYEYWIKGKRTVYPLHQALQSDFVAYLNDKGISSSQDQNFVDVSYQDRVSGLTVLCEVKPTERVSTKYAIRAAIGQLLEYEFTHRQRNPNYKYTKAVILSDEPRACEKGLLKSLSIKLFYRVEDSFVEE